MDFKHYNDGEYIIGTMYRSEDGYCYVLQEYPIHVKDYSEIRLHDIVYLKYSTIECRWLVTNITKQT